VGWRVGRNCGECLRVLSSLYSPPSPHRLIPTSPPPPFPPCTYRRYQHNAPPYPYRTIGCVFSDTKFYGNIQANDSVLSCDFDFQDATCWKAMESTAINKLQQHHRPLPVPLIPAEPYMQVLPPQTTDNTIHSKTLSQPSLHLSPIPPHPLAPTTHPAHASTHPAHSSTHPTHSPHLPPPWYIWTGRGAGGIPSAAGDGVPPRRAAADDPLGQ
jgi:hypothetical protein